MQENRIERLEGATTAWLFSFTQNQTDWKVRWLANNENLKPVRTKSEARERGRAGGKASGAARRRKADFRRTLNALLTTEIDSTEWTPILKAMGLDSTLESAVNMAMIKEALAGNVKAYVAIKDVLGQTSKSDIDLEEQQLRMAATKSKLGTDVEEEPEDDGFLDALNESAADDWDMGAMEGEDGDDEEKTTDI